MFKIRFRLKNNNFVSYTLFVLILLILLSPYILNLTNQSTDKNYTNSVEVDSYLAKLGTPLTFFYFPGNYNTTQFMVLSNYANSQTYLNAQKSLPLYYSLGDNILTSGFLGTKTIDPGFFSYILSTFSFKYLVISNLTYSNNLNNSSYFHFIKNIKGFEIFEVTPPKVNFNDILLTSSVTVLKNFISLKKVYPVWQYSFANYDQLNYLNGNGSLKLFIPYFFSPYRFFTYNLNKTIIIPSEYSRYTNANTNWAIGYPQDYPQETWTNVANTLSNYQFQNDLNPLYGVTFSNANNTLLSFNAKMVDGNYMVLSRVLFSNRGGEMTFSINGIKTILSTNSNLSYFSFIPISTVDINNGNLQIILKNNFGLNAVNVFYLIRENVFNSTMKQITGGLNDTNLNNLTYNYSI